MFQLTTNHHQWIPLVSQSSSIYFIVLVIAIKLCTYTYMTIKVQLFLSEADFLDGSNTGSFVMFSVIRNIYNKKTKGSTLMELFTATGKLKSFFFFFDN
jgi:hypothetical protein